MIVISEKDLPITVASKIIHATRTIPADEILAKTLNRVCGGDGTEAAFNDDELMEIAEHLMCYCKHKEQLKEQNEL